MTGSIRASETRRSRGSRSRRLTQAGADATTRSEAGEAKPSELTTAKLRAMGEARRILGVVFDAVGTLLLLREPVGETYARLAAARGVTIPAGRLDVAFTRVLAEAKPNVHPGVTLAVAVLEPYLDKE